MQIWSLQCGRSEKNRTYIMEVHTRMHASCTRRTCEIRNQNESRNNYYDTLLSSRTTRMIFTICVFTRVLIVSARSPK